MRAKTNCTKRSSRIAEVRKRPGRNCPCSAAVCRSISSQSLRKSGPKWKKLKQARGMVVEDPDIRGGEPCIRGTRVGVYEVASMLEQGASEEEILEGYPSLRRRQLELARIFAQAYPRKGRPPRHPWHQAP